MPAQTPLTFSSIGTSCTFEVYTVDILYKLLAYLFAGSEFNIKAKCVVNATGPYTDFIRKLDDAKSSKICQPSSGVHIVLPDYYR